MDHHLTDSLLFPLVNMMNPNSPSVTSTAGSSLSDKDEHPKYTPSMMVLQRRGLLTRDAGTKGMVGASAGGGKGSRTAGSNHVGMDGAGTGDGEDKDEQARKRLGMSLSYRGDSSLKANQSADIDDSENTSLFIQNLPPTCSYQELLGSIHSTGKIQSSHITPPGDEHNTSCAKLTLYTRASAEKLYGKIRAGEVTVRGYKLRCVWNRIKGMCNLQPSYISS